MIQTLIPAPVRARATGRRLGYALTPRTLLLLLAGCLLAAPGFFHPRWIWAMAAWDAAVVLLALVDAALLPAPAAITVERRFEGSLSVGEATAVELEITQESNQILSVRVSDALHPALAEMPLTGRVRAYPRDAARTRLECVPNARGDVRLGKVFLRYRGALELAERWAEADLEQEARVYPAMERSREDSQLYLLRIRQIALQKRKLRLRGLGREFESLREYQRGDEVRNIAWPATARRGKLITREFTAERSQQVWIVLDAGRLSRTGVAVQAHALRGVHERSSALLLSEKEIGADRAVFPRSSVLPHAFAASDGGPAFTVTQLDQATAAAVGLAQAVMEAGDKAGLLVYGRRVQQQLLPATGPGHPRKLLDALSQARAEAGEADHLGAAARLKHLQRRRGMILWITELADSARRPEIVDAALDLARRHLVLVVALGNPELAAAAARPPKNVGEMFVATAAAEVLERRRALLAGMRARGVLVVETTPGRVKAAAIHEYLEVKARGML